MKYFLSIFACFIISIILSIFINAQTQWEQYIGNPVIRPGAQGTWNESSSFCPTVILYKDTLRMWYLGSKEYGFDGVISIGYAWSLDGITWQQYSNNPVLSPKIGEWEYRHFEFPQVIADGDTLRMWYGGGNMTGLGVRIGYATSVDGINWNRYPKPVIEPNSFWNIDGVLPGKVIKEDGIFKMWFGGGVGAMGYPPASSKWSIGYATSSDGINWNLNRDPVITHGTSGQFDVNEALNASVIRTDSGYDLWYFGHNSITLKGAIGYASSSNGITWTKYDNNPVLSSASLQFPWAGNYYDPSVYFDGKIFHMWFTGWDHDSQLIAIGYATSGTSQFTGIKNHQLEQTPNDYKLFQNNPNPFNPSTSIKYSLPKQSQITLKIFDLLGREIETLVNEVESAGTYALNWNAVNLPSGVYLYKIQAGSFAETRKMLLLK